MLRNTSVYTLVSLADAQRVIKIGQKAAETGLPSNSAIVDAGGDRRDDPPQRIFDYERLAFPHEKQLP